MASARLLIGGAAATAALGVRVARSLYGRWRILPEPDRARIEGLAEDLKRKALDVRGAPDRARAERDLRAANETMAAALVETAEADPEIGEDEVRELREDLRRELERLAGADISASRGAARQQPPAGGQNH
jgi:aminoglycoside phosphotransferase